MIRLLLDQGIPYSTTHRLKEAGWDVVHVSDIGMSRATDEAILGYARDKGYACVTLDADFHALLAIQNTPKPSVIRIRQEGLNGAALAERLESVWSKIETALSDGAMVTLTEQTLRIHHLPIIKGK